MEVLILDALASGNGIRRSSIDVIGAGPRTIAGILESYGLDYRIARIEEVIRRPSRFNRSNVLMVSAMTMDFPAVRKISRYFGGKKIIGGPITSDTSVVPSLGFDLGVWGEGEKALDEIIRKGFLEGISEDLRSISNIIMRDGSLTGTRYLTREEFNSYSPSVKGVTFYKEYPNYTSARVYVEVVRSCSNFNRPKLRADIKICSVCNACYEQNLRKRMYCPQRIPPGCGYCSIPALYGPPKSRYLDKILSEVEGLIRLGVKRIVLSGADFLEYGRDLIIDEPLTHPFYPPANLDALEELLSTISSLIRAGNVNFEVENVKPCLVDEEVASLLGKYLKGSIVHVGVETGDQHHSELIGRPCGPKDSLRAIRLLKENGLRPYAYFIHSLPGQTDKVAESTMKIMKEIFKLGAEKITVYRFSPLPGSAFHKEKIVYDDNSKKIVKLAIELNKKRKVEFIGKVIEVLIAPSLDKDGYYGYPIRGGPVIKIATNKKLRPGSPMKVKIIGVLSDRLLLGRPV